MAAQEFQWVFLATKRTGSGAGVWFGWAKAERRVGTYYFYVLDAGFGPGFIKICTYFPYPAKAWLNGHEWAKRHAEREGIVFTALANGFAACPSQIASRPSVTGSDPPTCRPSTTAGWR